MFLGLTLSVGLAGAGIAFAAAPAPTPSPDATPTGTGRVSTSQPSTAPATAPGGRGGRGTGRGGPPTRDPNTEGYVKKIELADGELPPPDKDGNYLMGPNRTRHPLMTQQEGVPRGRRETFQITSADSKIYPGIAR